MSKVFKIGKYSIRALDDRNWVIEREAVPNLAKRKKTPVEGLDEPNTSVFGYFSTLQEAKEELAELVAKESSSFVELERWINKIKEI